MVYWILIYKLGSIGLLNIFELYIQYYLGQVSNTLELTKPGAW